MLYVGRLQTAHGLGRTQEGCAVETGFSFPVRVQAIIVGTGGHFLIRLGSQNEWDGQRDRGAEDGTIVKGL